MLNLPVISSISPVCLRGNFFGKLSTESLCAEFGISCPTTCIWGLGPRGAHGTGVAALLHWAQSGLGNGSCGHGSQPRGPVLSSHTWLVPACSDSRDALVSCTPHISKPNTSGRTLTTSHFIAVLSYYALSDRVMFQT